MTLGNFRHASTNLVNLKAEKIKKEHKENCPHILWGADSIGVSGGNIICSRSAV